MPDAYDTLVAEGLTCQGGVTAEKLNTGPTGTLQTGTNSDILVVRVTATDWVTGPGVGGKLEADMSGTSLTLPNSSLLPTLTGSQRMRVTLFNDPCCPSKREVVEVGPPTVPGTYPIVCRALEGTTQQANWRVGEYYCADMTAGQLGAILASMTGQSRNPPLNITNNFTTTSVTGSGNTMPNAANFTPAGIQS